MPHRRTFWSLTVVLVLIGVAAAFRSFSGHRSQRSNPAQPDAATSREFAETAEPSPTGNETDDSLPRLPETSLPPGLPIIPWGKRDHFPVIRNPEYLTAEQGDRALARDEPVLGLVINGKARAYSTNQLNDHEMVVDTIAGTPVLVTY